MMNACPLAGSRPRNQASPFGLRYNSRRSVMTSSLFLVKCRPADTPRDLVFPRLDAESDDRILAEGAGCFETMQPFDQNEARAVFANQNRRRLPAFQHALGDSIDTPLIERRPALQGHVDAGNRKGLALHHRGWPGLPDGNVPVLRDALPTMTQGAPLLQTGRRSSRCPLRVRKEGIARRCKAVGGSRRWMRLPEFRDHVGRNRGGGDGVGIV